MGDSEGPRPRNLSNEEQKKLLQEYTKLKSQVKILKKAVLQEQQKSKDLAATASDKEKALHASTEEIDRLHAANERLTKRVSKMMQDLEDSDGAGAGGGSLLGAIWSGGGGAELQQMKQEVAVLREELDVKIRENESIHMQQFKMKKEHDAEVEELQTHLQDTLTRGGELSDEVVRLKETVGQKESEVGQAKEESSQLQRQLEAQREDARTRQRAMNAVHEQLSEEAARARERLALRVSFDDARRPPLAAWNVSPHEAAREKRARAALARLAHDVARMAGAVDTCVASARERMLLAMHGTGLEDGGAYGATGYGAMRGGAGGGGTGMRGTGGSSGDGEDLLTGGGHGNGGRGGGGQWRAVAERLLNSLPEQVAAVTTLRDCVRDWATQWGAVPAQEEGVYEDGRVRPKSGESPSRARRHASFAERAISADREAASEAVRARRVRGEALRTLVDAVRRVASHFETLAPYLALLEEEEQQQQQQQQQQQSPGFGDPFQSLSAGGSPSKSNSAHTREDEGWGPFTAPPDADEGGRVNNGGDPSATARMGRALRALVKALSSLTVTRLPGADQGEAVGVVEGSLAWLRGSEAAAGARALRSLHGAVQSMAEAATARAAAVRADQFAVSSLQGAEERAAQSLRELASALAHVHSATLVAARAVGGDVPWAEEEGADQGANASAGGSEARQDPPGSDGPPPSRALEHLPVRGFQASLTVSRGVDEDDMDPGDAEAQRKEALEIARVDTVPLRRRGFEYLSFLRGLRPAESIPHGEALHIRTRWHAASARAKELHDSLAQERARADTAEGELRGVKQQSSSLHSKVQQLQDASQAAREEAELRECALRDRVEQLRTRADALAGKLRGRLKQGRSDGNSGGGSGGGGGGGGGGPAAWGDGAWAVDEEELELLAEDEDGEGPAPSPARAAATPETSKTRRTPGKQERERTPGHAAGNEAEAAPAWSITAQGEGAGPSGGASYTITVTDPSAAVLGGGSGARTLRLSAAERQREATLRRNYERQLSSTVRQVKLCEARALQYYGQYVDAADKIRSLRDQRAQYAAMLTSIKALMARSREELVTTKANYEQQLKVLSEHCCDLEDKVATGQDAQRRLAALERRLGLSDTGGGGGGDGEGLESDE